MMPLRWSLTVPFTSHSSEALYITRWFASHIALCDEHARSISTLSEEPMSSYAARTRSGGTCLSCAPVIISVGILVLPIIASFHPHVVVDGARRTPVPHFAPTGSDA